MIIPAIIGKILERIGSRRPKKEPGKGTGIALIPPEEASRIKEQEEEQRRQNIDALFPTIRKVQEEKTPGPPLRPEPEEPQTKPRPTKIKPLPGQTVDPNTGKFMKQPVSSNQTTKSVEETNPIVAPVSKPVEEAKTVEETKPVSVTVNTPVSTTTSTAAQTPVNPYHALEQNLGPIKDLFSYANMFTKREKERNRWLEKLTRDPDAIVGGIHYNNDI